ncbi:NAD(P)/FAD-dependent oxidoreductase [Robertkochia solimangrovi]|uniref:NAD(P)/FAD-dependent oxidoreductase n=1 Tax=Robertkochia solimangrovi TaxID=2213046 RepID=UPI001180B5B1|nr:FAD-dependent oxidoreductase [Robertkochia solimangrovi]TRZ46302.1 amino acid dehydrogenase [Robertkochia solimangrovi]
MKKKVVIIGGGIIGLSSAYYLHKSGHQVTVVDKSNFDSGASYVNAGYVTPSHFIPLAAPGMISKGIKWMFNSSSPFYMKPQWDTEFFKWAWSFHRSSTEAKVKKATPVLKDFNILSRDLFEELQRSEDLGKFHYERSGLLMAYKTEKGAESEIEVAEIAKKEGLDVVVLSQSELQALQPDAAIDAMGAAYYRCDGHSTPMQIMAKLYDYLKASGVEILKNTEVTDIDYTNGIIKSITTSSGKIEADEFVIASGSWSPLLLKKLGVNLKVQPGKGYRIDVKRPTGITIPAILHEAKIAITPMDGYTRFAGTMEFSGLNHVIRKERVNAIADAAKSFYTKMEFQESELEKAQCGLRPVSPDGLPFIGRTAALKNCVIGTGHAMMGWSLGPATGKLITEVIDGTKTSMAIDAFDPDRKFS